MSRFSKADAEALGWSFYHKSDEVVLRDGDNELGISKKVPASLRAEKMIDLPGSDLFRTTEEAPTIGLLLERIAAFEAHLEARLAADPGEVDARASDEPEWSFEDKQKAKQDAEVARVLAADSAEGLSPAEPGAEDEDLDSLTLGQLKSIAKEKGIRVGRKSKAKLVAAIKEAE